MIRTVPYDRTLRELHDGSLFYKVLLQQGRVYASVAPSFAASYPGIGIDALEKALKALGFAGAEETAIGATIVKKEYERILKEEKPNINVSKTWASR